MSIDRPERRPTCPDCGVELPPGAPAGQCPKCLLKAGMPGEAPSIGPGGTVVLPPPQSASRGLPLSGEQLGHYQIIQPLGAGGMGAVFEAEDLDTGRRVALKVLSHTLELPEARERFLREGRLAASINHPNSVYVFGTEEIGGTPVISMELVSGGTLQDRVRSQGIMPVAEAVDAVLQIIAGLEAAQKIGILHRDIKPSNCYLAEDGTVKIGDFGLSISTTIRTEPALTTAGTFLGTPAFCSPEQLRGDELNARSDMYSVGATLFYLLTGRTPFENKNPVQLLATVLEQPAPSPRKYRADIPQSLARVVQRCLEKAPSERFKNYRELSQALTPFSSLSPSPATLGLRFLAGFLDTIFLGIVSSAVSWGTIGNALDVADFFSRGLIKAALFVFTWFGATVVYYAFCESRWGASPGKAICQLRVVGPDKNPPGFIKASIRAVMYVGIPVFPSWVYYGLINLAPMHVGRAISEGSAAYSVSMQTVVGVSFYLLLGLLFCTARRRNGFAAVHDLVTHTRVITRTAFQARPALDTVEREPDMPPQTQTLGPYHILQPLSEQADASWLLGYDMRLLRRVWLRVVRPGTAPFPVKLRNIGRSGRLRWLTGRRSTEENWDAFEALSGKPLIEVAKTAQRWHEMRFWLHDLAVELNRAEQEGTLPPVLALDLVWITGDGRAKLLDFPAPSRDMKEPPQTGTAFPQEFLNQVATQLTQPVTRKGTTALLPLHAREFLKQLPSLPDAAAVAARLKPLLHRLSWISRWRRAAVVGACLVLPVFFSGAMLFGMTMMRQWTRSHPGLMDLNTVLQQRAVLRRSGKPINAPTDRQFSIYIANHHRGLITNPASWNRGIMISMIQGDNRRFAEKSVLEHPSPTAKEIEEADRLVKPLVTKASDFFEMQKRPFLPAVMMGAILIFAVGLPALICALAFRGGLVLRAASIAFVRRDGRPASRLRLFWRGLVAWTPVLGATIATIAWGALRESTTPRAVVVSTVVVTILVGALSVLSIALPVRGLQDRLSGTWPVPR